MKTLKRWFRTLCSIPRYIREGVEADRYREEEERKRKAGEGYSVRKTEEYFKPGPGAPLC